MERVPGLVDDRLEQLVPGPGGRRQAGDSCRKRSCSSCSGPGAGVPGTLGGGQRRRSGTSTWPSPYKRTEGPRPKGCGRVPPRARNGSDGAARDRSATRWGCRRRDRLATGRATGAVAAEPHGIGTAGARDPLAVEVRLLGALLGQVISEQAGPELFELVERIRRRTIALRRDDDPLERARLDEDLAGSTWTAPRPSSGPSCCTSGSSTWPRRGPASGRCRRRERAARDGILDDSVGDAVVELRRLGRSDGELDALVSRPGDLARPDRSSDGGPSPDDARRAPPLRGSPRAAGRSAADAVRGPRDPAPAARGDHAPVADLRPAPRRPDPARRGPDRDGLLRCHAVHGRAPVVPGAGWGLDDPPGSFRGPASDSGRTGTRPPRVAAFLRSGTWIGGDRDGNPGVTAEITERTLRIQADHVLRGHEAVATRLMQTIAAATSGEHVARTLRLAARARRRGPARDRSTAPPPLPRRAVPPALRVHRRAAAADPRRARGGAGAA